MKSLFLLFILIAAKSSYAEIAMDFTCSDEDVVRPNIINIHEFSCIKNINCAVAVNAPLEIEGRTFNGFMLVHNWRSNNDFDLAVDVKSEQENGKMVSYLYGTKDELESSQLRVSYWSKKQKCPINGLLQLKHNKALLSPSAGTR
jgi:hypothetical protein